MSTTETQRQRILDRDNWTCRAYWIALDVPCSKGLEVDHIVPAGRGGLDEDQNLWTLCSYCHNLKHGYPEAATYLGLYGRETLQKKYDEIQPEIFAKYMRLLQQKKRTLRG